MATHRLREVCGGLKASKDVYEWILEDAGINEKLAAEGLHNAVRDLKDRTWKFRLRHQRFYLKYPKY